MQEADFSFRSRIQAKAGRNTINQQRIETDIGKDLDEVGSFYGVTRMDGDIATLVPCKSDADLATEYRAELAPILEQVCDIFSRARKDGIILNFNISADQYGRMRVNEVSAVKPL